MSSRDETPPKVRKKFGDVWGELQYVCQKLSYWMYTRKDRNSARRYLSRLENILKGLPKNDVAILREEGYALLYELKDEKSLAIEHRKREIQLMVKLQHLIEESVRAGEFDEKMGASILVGRDAAALEERKAILKLLEKGLGDR